MRPCLLKASSAFWKHAISRNAPDVPSWLRCVGTYRGTMHACSWIVYCYACYPYYTQYTYNLRAQA